MSEGVTLKDLANQFLYSKECLVNSGELTPRTWADYKTVCEVVLSHFGKRRLVSDLRPEDLGSLREKMAKRWGPERLGSKLIQYTRSLFKYAYDADLIDRPIRFGPGFKRPSKKTLRLNRAEQGAKLFTPDEIRQLLGYPPWAPAAGVQMQAMILLAVNCGYGNSDCGNLPLSAVDLDNRVIDFARPKTGVARRCPLWPETTEALRQAIAGRPEPKDPEHAGLVFVTKYGGSWASDKDPGIITKEMKKLLGKLGINGHRNFYTLRHTHRTVADEAKDQPAADYIMGHESTHMSTLYRERISDERLKAVVDHARQWLFGVNAKPAVANNN